MATTYPTADVLNALAIRCDLARGMTAMAKTARAKRYFTNIARAAHRDMMRLAPVGDDIAAMSHDAILAELAS
jgi:hypothetical protein